MSSIQDGRLGMKLSHGCVRLAINEQNGSMIRFQTEQESEFIKQGAAKSISDSHIIGYR